MKPDADPYDCFYLLDAQDRLLDCGGPTWDGFAIANGGESLTQHSLKGDSIYDHVAGHFTKKFLREFFHDVRAGTGATTRTYRCDSPSAKRLMEMRVQPLEDGALNVVHRLVAETPLAVVVDCQEAAAGRRSRHQRCSLCNRLRHTSADAWREPDEYEHSGPLTVVHTVCGDCRAGVEARITLRPIESD